MELLSPAGNMEKLETALHFGADAVYLSGKKFGLRAAADNFDGEELAAAVKYAHALGRKVYVTMNIFAHETDFDGMEEYIRYIAGIGADAVIVSDLGILSLVRKCAPDLAVHVSTQANVTNSRTARFYADLGVKRIVLARELSLDAIKKIRDALSDEVELEAFVHGAMCISYSGRCLMSDYMTGRHANRGECAQSCRWEYAVAEKTRGEYMPVEEDGRGTYIFNSKDLNMIEHIPSLAAAGIYSLKIEGRVKSAYYVGSVTNAYRRAIDLFESGKEYVLGSAVTDCLIKTSHRRFTTGFYFGDTDRQCYETAKPKCDYDFCAVVTQTHADGVSVEMRGRFKKGDTLEILSSGGSDGKTLTVRFMCDKDGMEVADAKTVQQVLFLKTALPLSKGDMLRKKHA
ncbi:MAG: U32 family peptidase [Clostridia bacterium]|nr:U32 family peptidase [Clostridia bacterium]